MKELEAYKFMIRFLVDRYERDPSDEIGGLLGSLELAPDGLPFDPALAEDWQRAVETVRASAQVRTLELHRKAS